MPFFPSRARELLVSKTPGQIQCCQPQQRKTQKEKKRDYHLMLGVKLPQGGSSSQAFGRKPR